MNTNRVPIARLLAGLSFVAVAGYAAPAFADNECGVTPIGSAVCTVAGNPYASGITYSAPNDVVININTGVIANGTVSVSSALGAASVISKGQIATSGVATNGINANAFGDISITAPSVTTTGLNSTGISAISSGRAISINSGAVTVGANGGAAILALAQSDITITSGTASAQNASAIYAISKTGPIALTVTGANTSATADAVSLISGSSVTVNVAAGGSVVGQNALALTPQTTSTVTNAGTLTGTDGYAVMAKGGTTTVINSGTINSGVEFTGKGGSLVNSGTFNVTENSIFGGGTLNNSGTVQVTAAAPAGGVAFYGLASFTNSGTLSLANGRTGDVLTLPGTFTGSGASTLVLDTAPGASPDRLVIGGAATGITTVQLINAGNGSLNPGSVIVSAGAGTSATAFQLAATSVNAGFIQNAIAFNPAANSFSLVGTPSVAAYRPLYYTEGARNIWYKVSDVWQAHVRALRDGVQSGGRLWGQIYGSVDSRNNSLTTNVFGQTGTQNLSYKQDSFGGQLGLDLSPAQNKDGVTFGITGGYVNSDLHFSGAAARARYNVANAGAYAGFHLGGLFVNVLGQYAHYWVRAVDTSINFSQSFHGDAYGATGEAGFRFGDNALFIEPLVTVSYVRTKLDTFTALGSTFDFRDRDGVRGKAGARFGTTRDYAGGNITFYGGGNAVKAFQGRNSLVFTNTGTSVALSDERIGIYGEGFAGLSIASPTGVSGFFEAFGDFGRRDTQRGGGLRAGLRIGL
jgi:outer membrane autotransporter protein